MLAIPSVVSVVGTVLALAVAILLLAGLVLYVAFRVRETLHEERGERAKAVKVAFLVGVLFLSGGVFLFFASGFAPGIHGLTGTTTTQSQISTTSLSSSLTTSGTSATSSSSSSASTATTTESGVTVPAPSCQGDRVTAGSTFQCVIYIYDQGSASYGSSTVVSSGDFARFTFLNCTEAQNGGAQSEVPTSSSTISVGYVVPGTTVLTLTVMAPSQSGQNSNCVLTLDAPGLSQVISVTFSIQVTA